MPIHAGRQLALTLALILTCGIWSAAAQQNIDFEKLELQTIKVRRQAVRAHGWARAGQHRRVSRQ